MAVDDESTTRERSPYSNVDLSETDLTSNKSSKTELVQPASDDVPPEKQSCSQVWAEYPKSVFCIVGNEFCERFSYYGMRAILTLYLVNILKFEDSTATALYSAFIILCYFSPLIGSILADGYIGKFHTIMWVSLFYAAGNVTLAVASSFHTGHSIHPWLDFIGLVVIGLGTGGIKPCVQTFGADQFRKGQEKQLQQFFSIFYFSINAGSMISIFATPIIRAYPCMGQDSCYPLAFGIPAALMVVAVVFFAIGTFWYKKVPAEGNVFSQIAKVGTEALKNKSVFERKREHWLDHYMDNHSCEHDDECRKRKTCHKEEFVGDIKSLLRVLTVFVPLPIFWALYEQQGSTWVLQGTQLDGNVGSFQFYPDQMQVLNAVLVLLLIFLFQLVVYPAFSKCVELTNLRKMSVGGVLCGVAYIACMVLQFQINPTLPAVPDKGMALLTVINDRSTALNITGYNKGTTIINPIEIASQGYTTIPVDLSNEAKTITWRLESGGVVLASSLSTKLSPDDTVYTVVPETVAFLPTYPVPKQKSRKGEGQFSINVNYIGDAALCPENKCPITFCKGVQTIDKCNEDSGDVYELIKAKYNDTSDFAELKHGNWSIFIGKELAGTVSVETMGGIYTATVVRQNDKEFQMLVTRLAPDNSLSILWQVPQYVIISIAEVLFSISGNEFAYSQAPLSMKAVVFALWLLTDSVGQVVVLIISLSPINLDMAYLFLIYACLMFTVMVAFVFIAYRYKYTYYIQKDKKRES